MKVFHIVQFLGAPFNKFFKTSLVEFCFFKAFNPVTLAVYIVFLGEESAVVGKGTCYPNELYCSLKSTKSETLLTHLPYPLSTVLICKRLSLRARRVHPGCVNHQSADV